MSRRSSRSRTHRRNRGRFGPVFKLLCVIAVGVALTVGATVFFRVEVISVSGSQRYTQEDIIAASGIEMGDNLYALNKVRIGRNIRTLLPYIGELSITRPLPSTIVIRVTEWEAVARLAVPDQVQAAAAREELAGENESAEPPALAQEPWLISVKGKLLEPAPADSAVVTVTGLVPINAPVVLSNGAGLYDFQAGRMIHETVLPGRAAGDLAEVCAVFPDLGFESYHGDEVSAWNPNQVTWNHLRRARTACTVRPIGEMPLPWSKAILQQANPLLRQVQQYMRERWAEHYEIIFSNQVLLELTRKGSNKGGMVLYLADLLGIERAHIYCVGDNQNDIPMLEISAIPFAPANCAPEVRDWGAQILCSCDEGCLAQIVDILDTRY